MIKLKFAEHRSALTVKAIACKIQTTVHLKQLVRSNCSRMLLTRSYIKAIMQIWSWQEHKVKRLLKWVGLKIPIYLSWIALPTLLHEKYGIYLIRLSIIPRKIAQHMCRRSLPLSKVNWNEHLSLWVRILFAELICIYLKKRTAYYDKTLPIFFLIFLTTNGINASV